MERLFSPYKLDIPLVTPLRWNLSPSHTAIPSNIIAFSIWLLFMPEEEFSDGWTVGWEKWLFQLSKYFCFVEFKERGRIAASQEQIKNKWQTVSCTLHRLTVLKQLHLFEAGKHCVLHKMKRWGVGNHSETPSHTIMLLKLFELSSVGFSRNDKS